MLICIKKTLWQHELSRINLQTFKNDLKWLLIEATIHEGIFAHGHRKWLYQWWKESMLNVWVRIIILKRCLKLHKSITIYLFYIMKMRYFCSHGHCFDHCSLETPEESSIINSLLDFISNSWDTNKHILCYLNCTLRNSHHKPYIAYKTDLIEESQVQNVWTELAHYCNFTNKKSISNSALPQGNCLIIRVPFNFSKCLWVGLFFS